MQQRSSSCSSRAHGSGEHCVINVNQQQPVQVKQLCPPKKMDDMADLPVNHLHLDTKKMKKISLPWSAGKWVLHAIPVIVLLCFFLLWLFSYHGKVEKTNIYIWQKKKNSRTQFSFGFVSFAFSCLGIFLDLFIVLGTWDWFFIAIFFFFIIYH